MKVSALANTRKMNDGQSTYFILSHFSFLNKDLNASAELMAANDNNAAIISSASKRTVFVRKESTGALSLMLG